MNGVVNNDYLSNLLNTARIPLTSALPWLNQLRTAAVDCVSTLRMPTTSDEEWRFTNISSLTKLPFQVAHAIPQLKSSDIEHFFLKEASTRMVFIDGQYAPLLSSNSDDSGIVIDNMSALTANHSSIVAQHIGQYADFRNNVFVALNTAFLNDGALVLVPRNAVITADRKSVV